MGTTGRFGSNSAAIRRSSGHTWYATDYSELYVGLAVVIGFFLFLVLFIVVFILISYIRKMYRLKTRPQPTENIEVYEPKAKLSTVALT